ncbi:calcium-binding protein, putative [Bodo saltans]|uniref:Calcium-binding protein, putative n=1 Tax=Bodo saltans TaxID=75058 RepID=A0A0S4IRM4_BODSA|nr:calcium-binding protein, putative [Bodo saltans]|eukprot:CUE85253.1 calcium-binding protein, putative [Bodo saltans]
MFYALKFGEKPPHNDIRPMQPRGADSRAHIYSSVKPQEPDVAKMLQGSGAWAKHADPTAQGDGAQPAPARERTSALLQKRERGREIATKPQDAKSLAEAPAVVYAKPKVSQESPFAVDVNATSGARVRASQAYGAFAAGSPQRATPALLSTNERIHDTVPAHKALHAEPSQAVIGTFAEGPHVDHHSAETAAVAHGAHGPKVAPVSPTPPVIPSTAAGKPLTPAAAAPGHLASTEKLMVAVEAAVQPKPGPIVVDRTTRVEEAKALSKYALPAHVAPLPPTTPPLNVTDSKVPAAGKLQPPTPRATIHHPSQPAQIPPNPTNVIPNPVLPRTALSSGALQTLGNWKYQHTPHPLRHSQKDDVGDTASTAPSQSVVAPSAAGPQVDWWVKQQSRYEDDRKFEGTVSMRAALHEEKDRAGAVVDQTATLSKVNPLVHVPLTNLPQRTTPAAAAAATATPRVVPAGSTFPPGTQLTIQADGSIRVTPPAPSATAQQQLITNKAILLAAKPDGQTKGTAADLPPAAPHRILTNAVPIAVTNVMRCAAPVVQSVGGPAFTSIARKTHDAIREERDAQTRARWLAEAPARAEALQRKLDTIVKSLKQSVEAKGFSEPTKGAQFIIKLCRQHTSTPNEEMEFEGFRNVLQKGFSLTLTEDEYDGLFARMDLDETTVVPFRVFGEMVFGILRTKKQTDEAKLATLNPNTRRLLEDVKTKIARRHGGESWLLSFQKAFLTLNRVAEGTRGVVGSASGKLSAKDLHAALTTLGITPITLHDANNLVLAMDTDRNGTVDENEFLYAMRGPVSRKRRALIFQVFNILDADRSGEVTLDEIAARYDTSQHPRVLSGESTSDEVLLEFVSLWNRNSDAVVSWWEFLDYYKTLSASIENDDYFELMMRNCWHLSGGEGVAQNTTARRVLVTFHDKTQRVVELENDLGIGPRDLDKMMAKLASQGVKNIERIELYG